MSMLAVPWFVLVTTGSTARMGLTYAAEVLPMVVLGIPSGTLVARIGVRRTLIIGDSSLAVLVALIPALHSAGLLSFWLLLVIVGATGAIGTPYLAAQRVLLPGVLGDDEAMVTAGNALIEGSGNIAGIAGPALAGVLISALGTVNVIWIDAATFVFSALFLLGLPKARPPEAPPASRGRLAGLRYALRDGVIRRVVIASTAYGVVVPGLLSSLPVLAKVRYSADPQVAGWLLAAIGGGALAGTIAVPPLTRRLSISALLGLGAVAMAISLWFLPLRQPAVTLALIMASVGFCSALLNAPMFTIISTRPPEHLRAQVTTVLITGNTLARPIAYAATGFLFSTLGVTPVQLTLAVGYSLCAVSVLALVRYMHRANA
jgi:predicted MFS family arabinose efflux permease